MVFYGRDDDGRNRAMNSETYFDIQRAIRHFLLNRSVEENDWIDLSPGME